MTQPSPSYLDLLARRVLIYDGAMGTNIQRHHLSATDFGGKSLEGCNDHLVLTRPDVIRGIHESFLAVGCDVVETCTFQSTPRRLAEWGIGDRIHEINVAAARLARAACDAFATPEQPRFVAGSIGPTGMLPSSDDPTLSAITFEALADNFYEHARGLVEGGVDVLLVETAQDILEVKAAITGFERLFAELGRRIPVQAQVTLDTSGRMLLGTDVASALTTLEALRVEVIGLNCSTGPEHMRDPVRYLADHATRPISVIPNAGLPLNTGSGDAVYPLEPAPLAAALAEFVRDYGVRVVGGCCGTTPEHLSAVVQAVRGLDNDEIRTDGRVRASRSRAVSVPRISSAMRAITLHQDPAPLIVGERVNSQGSRAVKRLLLADDYDGIVRVGREQAESGAHVLDVCVALTERADEAEQMSRVVKLLSMSVETPLMIDSTEAGVIAAALSHLPGRGIVNSINMENGRKRIDDVLPLVRRHGAAVVALTIDEQGMARTRDRKLAIARRILEIATREFGLAPSDLIFDALTFTLATGEQEWIDSATETIEGIRLIKRELPGVLTILGVSNVSFGLTPEARAVLNSVFLHHCVAAGLDAAIVNPAHIRPYAEVNEIERTLADDLVFNRRPDALQRLIEHFAAAAQTGAEGTHESPTDPTAGMKPDERVHWSIVHRRKEGIEGLLDDAGVRADPVRVLNEVLLPAMREVGDKFGAGELILPFVLQSAEVMKKAVRHLEQFLERAANYTKGKVVLATVYGDVHDIGKSLVNTILANNGYTVFDLGKQVPVNTIIDKAEEVGADAIGLSALLVSTSKQMPLCVQELDRRKLSYPVLIGGAAINRRFGRRALFVEGERPYAPGVFYCKDAFEGLATMDSLMDSAQRSSIVTRTVDEARRDVFLHTMVGKDVPVGGTTAERRSSVSTNDAVPSVPFFGVRVVRDIPLAGIFALLDLDELYRLQWGGRGSGEAFDRAVREEFKPTLDRLTSAAERDGWLVPQAVYGVFPVQSQGNEVIVYDPAAYESDGGALREVARFRFPRQAGREHLCLADYFRPADSGEVDVLALQVVTVGDAATRRFDELQQAGEYAEAFYTHGLAVEAAEAVAEWLHRRIRREWSLDANQGKRYSWGYGACPDLDDHATVFKLLPAADALGMQLTSAWQLVPEQSTAALIVHHRQAKYYSIRGEGPGDSSPASSPPSEIASAKTAIDNSRGPGSKAGAAA
jgi:5-methyltetrahydrofolate--homocysteine methyltransferase